mgnify:CR=1 FL=1|jgi:hypothetical protein
MAETNTEELAKEIEKLSICEKNRGTGAGGANTYKNGLKFEEITNLKNSHIIMEDLKKTCMTNYKHYKSKSEIIKFPNSEKKFTYLTKQSFVRYMDKRNYSSDYYVNNPTSKMHGTIEPDTCYLNEIDKILFWIEIKEQKIKGSVCEKLQTAETKKEHLKKRYPEFKIEYSFVISNILKDQCDGELEYLKEKNIPVFFGNDTDYKTKIINFIINYK